MGGRLKNRSKYDKGRKAPVPKRNSKRTRKHKSNPNPNSKPKGRCK